MFLKHQISILVWFIFWDLLKMAHERLSSYPTAQLASFPIYHFCGHLFFIFTFTIKATSSCYKQTFVNADVGLKVGHVSELTTCCYASWQKGILCFFTLGLPGPFCAMCYDLIKQHLLIYNNIFFYILPCFKCFVHIINYVGYISAQVTLFSLIVKLLGLLWQWWLYL